MTEQPLIVVARIRAQDGKEEVLKETLLSLIAPTRAEPGCISYDLHQSENDRRTFLFFERWLTHQDLDDHLRTPYLQSFLGRSAELLAEPVDVTLWNTLP